MRGRPAPSSHPTKPSAYSLLQIPPLRYELIGPDLHRGGYPTLRNFPFLTRLNLRTIISLTPEPPNPDLALLAAHYHIQLLHFPVAYGAASGGVAGAVLGVVLKRGGLPAYVHCLDGKGVVGGVVGVLRRLQYWRLESCVAEYERMCGAGSGEALRELLSEWSEPIRLNSQLLPSWLWDGKWCTNHPTMTLLDESEVQRGGGEIVEVSAATSTGALPLSDKKKLKSSANSAQSATTDVEAGTAASSSTDPTAALLARWTKRRSWLYYDTLLSSQPITLPDDEPLYSVDRRMAGSTAYLDYLMVEGFTMTNTFPRPLPLLHITSTVSAAASSNMHMSNTEQPHGAHAHT